MIKHIVAIRVICENPPLPLSSSETSSFGLQGKNQEILAGEIIGDRRVKYEFTLHVDLESSSLPNFTGAYAHGTPADRFLYLTQLELRDGNWQIIKRIKISLKSITQAQIEAALSDPYRILQVSVDGRGAATVSLLGNGWTVEQRADT